VSPEDQGTAQRSCFVGHSNEAAWRADVLSACAEVLPKFDLEPWYAADHYEPTKTLRDKVVEAIANARYGIYDLSSWLDANGAWHLPRNVLIELGIAIVYNRPTLLLRHTSNSTLLLPVCLQGVELLEFAGETTLKRELEKRLPQWIDAQPERDWFERFCIFGSRVCAFREQHPRSQSWDGISLPGCHIADGLDKDDPLYQNVDGEEIHGAFDEVFTRYANLPSRYLDQVSLPDGFRFRICSYCQTVRMTSFGIYRVLPFGPEDVFLSIGMSIALGAFFDYEIPRILVVEREDDLPSLLRGYEVLEARSTSQLKQGLKARVPAVMQKLGETQWKPRPLPFIEAGRYPVALTTTIPTNNKAVPSNLRLLERIADLTGGSPLLLALVATLLSESDLADLAGSDQAILETRTASDFEEVLVRRLIESTTSTELGRAMMALSSHPGGTSAEELEVLIGVSANRAQELMSDLRTLSFVKDLHDGQIALHDRVGELLRQYSEREINRADLDQTSMSTRTARVLGNARHIMSSSTRIASDMSSSAFVGRDRELSELCNSILSGADANSFLIRGRGGIGKTFLLLKLQELLTSRGVAVEIIDLYNMNSRTVAGFQSYCSYAFGAEHFPAYLSAQSEVDTMRMAGVKTKEMDDYVRVMGEHFLREFNGVTAQTKVALLLDSWEALETDRTNTLGAYLLEEFAPGIRNMALVIAGREVPSTQHLQDKVKLMELTSLTTDEIGAYLQHSAPWLFRTDLHAQTGPE
jgi:hypothetical protein